METRGVLAYYDRRLGELVVYSSTQFPHVIRTILAQSLGIAESTLRVVAPDVGGGFGIKNTGMLHWMQTNAQAEAIAAPGAYAEGIENLIKSLKEVQDMAATPYHNG